MIKRFFLSIACFALIDAIWLSTIAQPFYQEHLGDMLRTKTEFVPAILFYFIYLLGLNFFVIHPNTEHSKGHIFTIGALFGLCCYATFDLTSLAVFEGFPTIVAVVDMIWGGILSGSVALGTIVLDRRLSVNQ
ncbi:MAG: DUF2177 family protein [Myxococcota bacterium]